MFEWYFPFGRQFMRTTWIESPKNAAHFAEFEQSAGVNINTNGDAVNAIALHALNVYDFSTQFYSVVFFIRDIEYIVFSMQLLMMSPE